MTHNLNCLIYLCTCNPKPQDEEYDEEASKDFFAKLDGLDQIIQKGEEDYDQG